MTTDLIFFGGGLMREQTTSRVSPAVPTRQDGRALFSELITLAEEQPPKNLKEASFKIGHRMDLHGFIVPVQARSSFHSDPREGVGGRGLSIGAIITSTRLFSFPPSFRCNLLTYISNRNHS